MGVWGQGYRILAQRYYGVTIEYMHHCVIITYTFVNVLDSALVDSTPGVLSKKSL